MSFTRKDIPVHEVPTLHGSGRIRCAQPYRTLYKVITMMTHDTEDKPHRSTDTISFSDPKIKKQIKLKMEKKIERGLWFKSYQTRKHCLILKRITFNGKFAKWIVLQPKQ